MLCPANHAAVQGEQLLAGGTDRLINPSMRCSTWRGNDLTKLNRQVQLWVCPRFKPPTPHLCISYTGRMPVYLLSFIPSASCRSNSGRSRCPASFTILSPSPLLDVETHQQVQATSDRSRISTKACSPITCVTGCATKSQLFWMIIFVCKFSWIILRQIIRGVRKS